MWLARQILKACLTSSKNLSFPQYQLCGRPFEDIEFSSADFKSARHDQMLVYRICCRENIEINYPVYLPLHDILGSLSIAWYHLAPRIPLSFHGEIPKYISECE
jgi:hypothetical protein